ncbi:MAG: response regulator transcription factor [Eubacteriales bacterium]
MKHKILFADDDSMLRTLLLDILTNNDYQVLLAKDGQEAVDIFFQYTDISLCILDVMMPIYTGYEVLETIREHSNVPIIMLTALGQEQDELKGLKKGANDYISKPFSYPILMARIENLLVKQNQVYERDKLRVDTSGHTVFVENHEVSLSHKEFFLLSSLIAHEGKVVSREQLLGNIWGYDYDGEIRTVDTHVKLLRKKLGICGEYVVTVRGSGYKFQVKS